VVKVRPTLCQLNNLRHALALARIGRDEAPAAWKLAAEVTALRCDWFAPPEDATVDRALEVVSAAPDALVQALWRLGERTETPENAGGADAAAPIRLAPPWSSVTLVPSDGIDAPRLRIPHVYSARLAEFAWRAARPRIALHPNVLDLLAGRDGPEVEQFRSSRDGIVRGYRDWIRASGPGYAELGLAAPFLPARSEKARA
jgi:hypothetical protein